VHMPSVVEGQIRHGDSSLQEDAVSSQPSAISHHGPIVHDRVAIHNPSSTPIRIRLQIILITIQKIARPLMSYIQLTEGHPVVYDFHIYQPLKWKGPHVANKSSSLGSSFH